MLMQLRKNQMNQDRRPSLRMKNYKFYSNGSNYFLNSSYYESLKNEEREYHHFASVLLSWVALESFVNSLAISLVSGKRLNRLEKAFLKEFEIRVNEEGLLKECGIRPSTTKKILFLLQYFSKTKIKAFKQTVLWENLKNFEDLRNRIMHHKEKGDIKISLNKAYSYRDIVDQTKKELNKKLFGSGR